MTPLTEYQQGQLDLLNDTLWMESDSMKQYMEQLQRELQVQQAPKTLTREQIAHEVLRCWPHARYKTVKDWAKKLDNLGLTSIDQVKENLK